MTATRLPHGELAGDCGRLARHGTAVINAGLSVFYNPEPDFVGQDSFSYNMIDGDGGSASGTITVDILEADDIPIAVDDSDSVGEGQTISISILANDLGLGDEPFTVAVTSGPAFPGCAVDGVGRRAGKPGLGERDFDRVHRAGQ